MKAFAIIVGWIDDAYKYFRTLQRQRERDKVEDDPAEWFDDHFNGVRDDSSKADKTNDKTNKS